LRLKILNIILRHYF